MKIVLVCLGLLGVVLAAPEPPSWPYGRETVWPYHYGHPGKTRYVYRASIEDDEDPEDRSRQDSGQLVSALIHNAAVKQQEQIQNVGNDGKPATVVETGSVAPVQDKAGESSSASSYGAPHGVNSGSPSAVKPGVVNPPAFPSKRPPQPPPAPSKGGKPGDEDDEDQDEDEDEASNEDENEEEEEEEEEEEAEEEERRRNAPLEGPSPSVSAPSSSQNVNNNETSVESSEIPVTNVKVQVAPVKTTVEESGDVNDVEAEGRPDSEDDVSEESSLDGVEAFVPGYVTDQGEVLVPVDTVTGDQPISIVPDPYTPPSRGVPFNYYGHNNGYNAPRPYPQPGRLYRQEAIGPEEDESQEDEEDEEDEDEKDEDEEDKTEAEKPKKKNVPPPKPPLHLIPASAPTNEDDERELSNQRYRSEAFPPSRSPLLYPVTFRYNGGYLTGPFQRPVASSEVHQYIQPRPQVLVRRRPPVSPNGFYSYGPQAPVRRRPTYGGPQRVTGSLPASIIAGYQLRGQQQGGQPRPGYNQGYLPYALAPVRPYSQPQPQYLQRPPTLHNPGEKLKIKSSYELLVEPSAGKYVRLRTKKRPANKKRVSNKKKTSQKKRRPVTAVSRPAPVAGPYRQPEPAPYGARPNRPPVLYRPMYNVQPLTRVPAQGYRQPPPYLSPQAYGEYQGFLEGVSSGFYGGGRPSVYNRRPTPVIQQDEPGDSYEPVMVHRDRRSKTRREAKKVKKNKKVLVQKKIHDPLNLLTKITKRPKIVRN